MVHQSMTDYCHTALRKSSGLDMALVQKKFGPLSALVSSRLEPLKDTYLAFDNQKWSLNREGRVLSNLIFEKLTFLGPELSSAGLAG